MEKLQSASRDELLALQSTLTAQYEAVKAQGLKLDMSRGKPGREQLELSREMLFMPGDESTVIDGMDAANYGVLEGLPTCRRMFAELLGVKYEQIFIGGNASLTLMYDTVAKAFTNGLLHSTCPWSKLDKIKFLCVVPGYDRHFTICESFGIEMIPVQLREDGPDMDAVEELIKDETVRGMWCVPKYANPAGITYSDAVIDRIARMKPAAPDFLLMWDNAYCVHEFDGDFVPFRDIISECAKYGNEDMVFEFASTSKITFPGAGVSCFACSEANMAHMKKMLKAQTISFDKLNQLRHIMFFKNSAGVLAHMKKHAAVLKPKFDMVLSWLDREIAPLEIASWCKPRGGYFVSFDAMHGTASRIHALCKEAGLVMTEAGATYPYHNDPNDSNLRIAPSLPPVVELDKAMELFCLCVKLAAVEKLLAE
ncbi:MAG: aminotransferase [Clostridia bacterium]|nr:aminotransferase [Clostridia bacterium]